MDRLGSVGRFGLNGICCRDYDDGEVFFYFECLSSIYDRTEQRRLSLHCIHREAHLPNPNRAHSTLSDFKHQGNGPAILNHRTLFSRAGSPGQNLMTDLA
jgi:hypothetical protein